MRDEIGGLKFRAQQWMEKNTTTTKNRWVGIFQKDNKGFFKDEDRYDYGKAQLSAIT